ncbi:DBH-like monooxygenase protein [Seminavis robusta]|uniref:DBH-like monooxygenase protein n=1 Tax=Seminavis robusta TaxID=568900 RepID=A0A9N8EJ94_9STRA|nr:DBH-like monooxygenase protein [Seminavis robusta]|eukprot:Sro1075_g238450.1 DBH-like monooxygenase protein (867) ;mRNA; f:29187-31866
MERSTPMDGNGCSHVQWTVDREAMTLQMAFKSTEGAEWVGLGIAEFGSMKGADIMLVKMIHNNDSVEPSFVVEDLISTDFVKPRKDLLQNVELLRAEVDENGRIHALVERPLDSCDIDDIAIEAYKQTIICASGYLDDGNEIAYHGPRQHSSTTVNLIVDEDLLYGSAPSFSSQSQSGTVLLDEGGIVKAHGFNPNSTTSSEPIAVDIQLPNISLPQDKVTSFVCVAFKLHPGIPLRSIAVETVWGDGQVRDASQKQPDHIHHQVLLQCDGFLEEGSNVEGQAYSCEDEMPLCPLVIGNAKAPLIQFPPGVHVPLDPSTYILQVHYENTAGMPIVDDRAGVRVWAEPPSLPSRSKPAKNVGHGAFLNTIHIPADPEQKEYAIHFQIPAEATQALLPAGGVDVFSAMLHMHKKGVRGRLQLIRDGVHVMDVFDTLSFDFNSQQPKLKMWKYLPGDALIITCIYEPHKDKPIYGGQSDNDEEMCTVFLAMTPPVPGYDRALGIATPADQAFANAYVGQGLGFNDNRTEEAIYAPTYKDTREFKPLQDHRTDLCALGVHDMLHASEIRLSDPGINIALYLILLLIFVGLVSSQWPAVKSMTCERTKRNTVCYILELLYGTVALPFLLQDYVSLMANDQSIDAVHADLYTATRTIGVGLTFLYLAELFYKLKPRFDLVLHHAVAIIMAVMCFAAGIKALSPKATIKLGATLGLTVATEQPMFLALLLKNLGFARHWWWPKMCYFAAVFNAITKSILIALFAYILAISYQGVDVSWEIGSWSFSKWLEPSSIFNVDVFTGVMSFLLVLLTLAQVFLGRVMFALAYKYNQKGEIKGIPSITNSPENENFSLGSVDSSPAGNCDIVESDDVSV